MGNHPAKSITVTNARLQRLGYVGFYNYYYWKTEPRGNYSDKPPYTDPYVRWCEGTVREIIPHFPLDWYFGGTKKELIESEFNTDPCLLQIRHRHVDRCHHGNRHLRRHRPLACLRRV